MTACNPTDRVLQTLRVHAPGAHDGIIELELFNVVDEFFRRTSVWRYTTELMLDENLQSYPLALPDKTALVRMLAVEHQGLPVFTTAQTEAQSIATGRAALIPDFTFPDGDSGFHPDRTDLDPVTELFSYAVYQATAITISIPPTTEQARTPLAIIAALTVDKCCLECDSCGDWSIPDWMWSMFFQEFVDGTLGRLYMMPSKPWANKEQGVYHSRRFRNSMGFRKQEAPKGFIMGVPGWQFPRGGWIG